MVSYCIFLYFCMSMRWCAFDIFISKIIRMMGTSRGIRWPWKHFWVIWIFGFFFYYFLTGNTVSLLVAYRTGCACWRFVTFCALEWHFQPQMCVRVIYSRGLHALKGTPVSLETLELMRNRLYHSSIVWSNFSSRIQRISHFRLLCRNKHELTKRHSAIILVVQYQNFRLLTN